MNIPLLILAGLSTLGGFIELPHTFGHFTVFSDFLKPVLPAIIVQENLEGIEWMIQLIAAGVALSGVYVAYIFYIAKPGLSVELKSSAADLHSFFFNGWGFDAVYDKLIVRPFVWIANINKKDIIDRLYDGLVWIANSFNRIFTYTQSGILRWYIMGIVVGAILLLALGVINS
jgi:NADH-quinone oxidoreductase subunit L